MICMGVADEDAFQIAQGLPNVRWPSLVQPEVSCHLAPRSLTRVEQNIAPIWDLDKLRRYYSKINAETEGKLNEIVTIAVSTTDSTVSPKRYHNEFVTRSGHRTVRLCQAGVYNILRVRELLFSCWWKARRQLCRDG